MKIISRATSEMRKRDTEASNKNLTGVVESRVKNGLPELVFGKDAKHVIQKKGDKPYRRK